jgi:predicted nucleic acid-binding protein
VGASKDEPKRERALELIESEDFRTSAQVLQEFFVTEVRKAPHPLSTALALEWIETVDDFSLPGSRPSTGADRD